MTEYLLYERIRARNPNGLPYEVAVQIFLQIYCTTEYLPIPLRSGRFTKEALVETFEELTGDGLILLPGSTEGDDTEFTEWADLVWEFLSGRIEQDFSFGEKICDYL